MAPSTLLTLPSEIRTAIYSYLVPSTLVITRPVDSPFTQYDDGSVINTLSCIRSSRPPTPTRTRYLALEDVVHLRLTSKALRAEVDEIVRRELCITVKSYTILSSSYNTRDMRWLLGKTKADVTRISLIRSYPDYEDDVWTELADLRTILRRSATHFPKLRQIDISLDFTEHDSRDCDGLCDYCNGYYSDESDPGARLTGLASLIETKRILVDSKSLRRTHAIVAGERCTLLVFTDSDADISSLVSDANNILQATREIYDDAKLVELDIDAELRKAMEEPGAFRTLTDYICDEDEWIHGVFGKSPAELANFDILLDSLRGGLDPERLLFRPEMV
ncbi:uncharacterized protein AB675_5162 [Cyphellophora attinorum]|uniref:F-box domain-containing protein n=1 Tax=Cyphellophora attinorum TaxID=1664694 RepID=A0A0N1HAA6_9EURO|nr:uncharacterized protein AB675_5162 [Phialophora attinorum]KPI39475.1 hypothetical protein AB675_5162 [Phialophora attinorum]